MNQKIMKMCARGNKNKSTMFDIWFQNGKHERVKKKMLQKKNELKINIYYAKENAKNILIFGVVVG